MLAILLSNGEWDSSTWIVGIPAIVAGAVFVGSILILIITSILSSNADSTNKMIDKRQSELNSQKSYQNAVIDGLSKEKQPLEKKLKNMRAARDAFDDM